MANIRINGIISRSLLGVLAATLFFAQGCGDDDSSDDDAPVIPVGGRAGASAGGRSGNGGGNQAGESPNGGTGNTGNDAGAGGTGNAGPGGAGGTGAVNEGGQPSDCVEEPETNDEFLNRCTDSRCAPFDNYARIDGYDGTLPDL